MVGMGKLQGGRDETSSSKDGDREESKHGKETLAENNNELVPR